VSAHELTVTSKVGRSGWRASCTCGWISPEERTERCARLSHSIHSLRKARKIARDNSPIRSGDRVTLRVWKDQPTGTVVAVKGEWVWVEYPDRTDGRPASVLRYDLKRVEE
jgi:hypothetical protein